MLKFGQVLGLATSFSKPSIAKLQICASTKHLGHLWPQSVYPLSQRQMEPRRCVLEPTWSTTSCKFLSLPSKLDALFSGQDRLVKLSLVPLFSLSLTFYPFCRFSLAVLPPKLELHSCEKSAEFVELESDAQASLSQLFTSTQCVSSMATILGLPSKCSAVCFSWKLTGWSQPNFCAKIGAYSSKSPYTLSILIVDELGGALGAFTRWMRLRSSATV